jgi:hypothetical protein
VAGPRWSISSRRTRSRPSAAGASGQCARTVSSQLAVAAYAADAGGRRGESILLLTLAGDGAVRELTAFRDPGLFPLFGLPTAMDSKPATDH